MISRDVFRSGRKQFLFLPASLLFLTALALPVSAKYSVDFDPAMDFSRFKTFAYVGPIENLVMTQVNPDLIDTQLHRAVVAELSKKGLREVAANQNPDLVIRYWVSTEAQVNVAVMGDWGSFGSYIDGRWGAMYNSFTGAVGKKEATLILDLIDTKGKTLAWRLYVSGKLSDPDKNWKKIEDQITEGLKTYPPPQKDVAGKSKETSK